MGIATQACRGAGTIMAAVWSSRLLST